MDKDVLLLRGKKSLNIVKKQLIPHQCLHHLHPLPSHAVDNPHHIHSTLFLSLPQSRMQSNEHACSTNSCTAGKNLIMTLYMLTISHIIQGYYLLLATACYNDRIGEALNKG